MARASIQLTGDLKGVLDVKEGSSFGLVLSGSDVRDLTSKGGNVSKQLLLADTKNNHKLLNHYFDVNAAAGDFDYNKTTPCIALEEGVPVMDNAVLQITRIIETNPNNNNKQRAAYEVLIKDQTANFFTKLGNSRLEDLRLTDINHVYNAANVIASFNNTAADGFKYLMPYTQGNVYNLSEFRPAIYAIKYFNRIFEAAGFSYEWADKDAANVQFSKWLIPYNGEAPKLREEQIEALRVEANKSTPTDYEVTGNGLTGSLTGSVVQIDTETLDTSGAFNPATYAYTSPVYTFGDGALSFELVIDWELYLRNNEASTVYLKDTASSTTVKKAMYKPVIGLQKNGSAFGVSTNLITAGAGQYTLTEEDELPVGETTLTLGTSTVNLADMLSSSGNVYKILTKVLVNQPNTLRWKETDAAGGVDANVTLGVRINSVTLKVVPSMSGLGYGATIYVNDFIPKNVKQADFIKSIFTMCNIYPDIDQFNASKLILKSRDKFYDTGKEYDMTKKLDKSKDQITQFLPFLQAKKNVFTYKQDTDDVNKGYLDNTGEVYGQLEFTFDNEFVRNTDTKELIFSPTPVGLTSFGAVTPYINGVAPKNNIRVLLDGGETALVNTYRIIDYVNTSGVEVSTTSSMYPHLSHFNKPVNPTFDLNFGVCDYYFYSTYGARTNNNLFNLNWRRTLNQMNTGKMLTAYFNLTPAQISKTRLNDRWFILNAWWNINKIEYDVNSTGSTKCELISVDSEQKFTPFQTKKPLKPIKGDQIFKSVTGLVSKIFKSNSVILTDAPIDVQGKNNVIGQTVKAGAVYGDNNNVSATKALVVGDGITADEDGVYTPNLFLPEGGTLNGIDVSKFTNTTVIGGKGVSINAVNTKFDIQVIGVIVDPVAGTTTKIDIDLTAQTVTNLTTHKVTYIAIKKDGTIQQKTSPFTNSELVTLLGEWVLVHSNLTNLNAINPFPERGYSLANQLHSMMRNNGIRNIRGNDVTPNGANLSINISAGTLERVGVNADENEIGNPNEKDYPAKVAPNDLRMRTKGDYESANTAFIDTVNYDDGSPTPVAIPSASQFQTMRIARFTSDLVRVQYGQTLYGSMAEALAHLTDTYQLEKNIAENGCVIAFLIVRKNTTDLSDTSRALFVKIGLNGATTAALIPTFQNVYEVSPQPQIKTNATNGAVEIEGGTGNDADVNFRIKNNARSTRASINANGDHLTDNTINDFTSTDGANQVDRVLSDPTLLSGFKSGVVSTDTATGKTSYVQVDPDLIEVGSTDLTNAAFTRHYKNGDKLTFAKQEQLDIDRVITSGTGQEAREVKTGATINTANATPTAVINAVLQSTNVIYWVNVQVVGRETGGGIKRYYANLRAAFDYTGTIVQIGTTDKLERSTFTTALAEVYTDATNIIVRVTGEAATSIDWTVTLTTN